MRPNPAFSRWDAAAELLGKNDAYRASGTMTNQVALCAHTEACERGE
jgi:threonine aldolase